MKRSSMMFGRSFVLLLSQKSRVFASFCAKKKWSFATFTKRKVGERLVLESTLDLQSYSHKRIIYICWYALGAPNALVDKINSHKNESSAPGGRVAAIDNPSLFIGVDFCYNEHIVRYPARLKLAFGCEIGSDFSVKSHQVFYSAKARSTTNL